MNWFTSAILLRVVAIIYSAGACHLCCQFFRPTATSLHQ